jgi:excinuclease UvrABC nuclease subunit
MIRPVPPAINVSSLLKPGVFLLLRGERVAYVGKAKCILAALANHTIRNRTALPAWFPVQRIPFDGIEIIPCDTTRAAALATALISLYKPVHNRSLKPGQGDPLEIVIPPHTIHPASFSSAPDTLTRVRRL